MFPSDTVMNWRLVHELKGFDPIDVTELGIVMLFNEVHSLNAPLPKVFRPSLKVTVPNAEHIRNAAKLINVSEFGNVILCNAEHEENVYQPIV